MNYPLISEYIQAILSAEDNFDQLTNLRPVLNSDNLPIMSSGNFAVVFKMQDISTNKFYALKCFIKEQDNREGAYEKITNELKDIKSSFIVKTEYYKNELFVDSNNSSKTEFPILLMDWVEGVTLDKFISKYGTSQSTLEYLHFAFCEMSSWLIQQPFAHGDLKPDNIIVTESWNLVLIDYDGMYTPSMKGEHAREIGTQDYRHPERTLKTFDKNIDYFSIVTIALSLKAFSLDSSLFSNHFNDHKLLLSEPDYRDIKSSEMNKVLSSYIYDFEFAKLYSLFIMLFHQQPSLSLLKDAVDVLPNLTTPLLIPYKLNYEENGTLQDRYLIYNTLKEKPVFETQFKDVLFLDRSGNITKSFIASIGNKIISPLSSEKNTTFVVDTTHFNTSMLDNESSNRKDFALITQNVKYEQDILFYNNLIPVIPDLIIAQNEDSKLGFIDSNNKKRSPFIYKKIKYVSNNKNCVFICKNSYNKYGILDSELNIIVDFNYNNIYLDDDVVTPSNIAVYTKEDRYYGIDLSSFEEKRLPHNMDSVYSYNEGIATIKLDGKGYILYDFLNEKTINDKIYSQIDRNVFNNNTFYSGMALCRRNNLLNIIVDRQGEEIIIPFEKKLERTGNQIFILYERIDNETERQHDEIYRFTVYKMDEFVSSFIYNFGNHGQLTFKVKDDKFIHMGSISHKYIYTHPRGVYNLQGNPVNDQTFLNDYEGEYKNATPHEDHLKRVIRKKHLNHERTKCFEDFIIDVYGGIAKVTGIADVDPEFGLITYIMGYADANHYYWEDSPYY